MSEAEHTNLGTKMIKIASRRIASRRAALGTESWKGYFLYDYDPRTAYTLMRRPYIPKD